MKLYVGKLNYAIDHDQLKDMFEKFGEITYAKVITDDTGRSKGFGFVEIQDDENAQKAIKEMDGKEHLGLNLTVSEAKS